MLDWLKWRLAGDELRALHRYRKACALVWQWNAAIPASADTADWIRAVGEDERGADIQAFRERLRKQATGPQPHQQGEGNG